MNNGSGQGWVQLIPAAIILANPPATHLLNPLGAPAAPPAKTVCLGTSSGSTVTGVVVRVGGEISNVAFI